MNTWPSPVKVFSSIYSYKWPMYLYFSVQVPSAYLYQHRKERTIQFYHTT